MKSVRSFALFLIVSALLVSGVAYANCGMDHGKGGVCPMDKAGDYKSTIMEAAAALKETHPDLSAKLEEIAAKCCEINLHQGADAEEA
ncbi:MAG: hypothetical protein HYT89_00795 [Candidatus Omnitrophica bacterium]|nr:hypothetical protein [Candidatus Omnitrophota bacterium]